MCANVQLARVCPLVVKSSKLAKLPNLRNGIHEELRSTRLNPERRIGERGKCSSIVPQITLAISLFWVCCTKSSNCSELVGSVKSSAKVFQFVSLKYRSIPLMPITYNATLAGVRPELGRKNVSS